jgi:hypothetical protein
MLLIKIMRKSGFLFLYLLLIATLFGCQTGIKKGKDVEKNKEKIKIADYGRALFAIDPDRVKEGLDSLTEDFNFFTGVDHDTLQIIQIREFITDPFNRELYKKTQQKYPDLVFLEEGLTETFGNISSAVPGFRTPHVYTYVSGLLYESPVQYLDSVLIIGLDMFLGWDYEQYRAAGLPVFLTRRMEKPNIIPECARQYAITLIPEETQPKTLLDFMLYHGKVLYAMDQFLPGTPDSLKIGYTRAQMEWCQENEASVWRLFIDQEMLYRSDGFLNNRFIQDGPFTAGLPDGAPAMLGRYVGWQIVKSFMKKNTDTDLLQLFELSDSQQILSQSGYKPKR